MSSPIFNSVFQEPISHIDNITLVTRLTVRDKEPLFFDFHSACNAGFKKGQSRSKRVGGGFIKESQYSKFTSSGVSISIFGSDFRISIARSLFNLSNSVESLFLSTLNDLTSQGILFAHVSWESLLYSRFSFHVEHAITCASRGMRFESLFDYKRGLKVYYKPVTSVRAVCDAGALIRFETVRPFYPGSDSSVASKLEECFQCADISSLTRSFILLFPVFSQRMTTLISRSCTTRRSLSALLNAELLPPRRRERGESRSKETKRLDDKCRRALKPHIDSIAINNTPDALLTRKDLKALHGYEHQGIF